jgi:hypothetical protein
MSVAAFLRCDTFYIQPIDAGYHRGLPLPADVHSLGACNHKSTSTPDNEPSLVPSIGSSGYWIVRVPFPSLLTD